ncbi:MAG: ATP-binding cassette domain-containing protein, partial [Clostridia bacterium]|nr:ATP-binding cassette domain-containing protein [Clostridia bacterium]
MEGQQKKKRENIFRIFTSPYARQFIKKYKWNYLIGIVILIVIDVLQTDVPLIVGDTIDAMERGAFTAALVRTQLIHLAVIAAVVFLGRIFWRWFIFGSARKIERDMRNDLYSHLQTLSAAFFQEHKAGEIMAYMTSDIEAVRMVFAVTVMMGMDTLTIGATTLYKMMTRIDVRLSVVAFIPLILVALTTTLLGGEMHRRFTRKQEAFADLADFVQEKLGGIKVIKAFVQERREWDNFDRSNRAAQDANIKMARMAAFMFPFMRMVAGFSMALAIAYGGYIAILGRISVGNFAAFVQFLNMLVWPMAAIGRIINIMTQGSASMKRLETILHARADIVDGPEAVSRGIPAGTVEARDLTFAYPGEDRPVLEHVSFKLERGKTLGIVGRTGSGKTSLVNLMMRVFDPDKNMLYIGGRELHEIPLADLRRAIGYVPQDNFLFSDTISANIAFGDRDKTQEEVEAAARAACVHDNIVDFAEGYETMVG